MYIISLFITTVIFGHISGSHINPQLTMASLILGKTEPLEVFFYLMGQFSGATTGYVVLWTVLPDETYRNGLCLNTVNGNITVCQGLIVEIISTATLTLACASIWDAKNARKIDSISLRLGLIIAVIAMVAGPFTGASMNSARSFAPALINNLWENHWVYWVGPTFGSIVAAVIYRFLFEHFDDMDREQTTESVVEDRL
ncbi:aquaporin-4 isoform X1 [Agrilus planipennis]|uniref:Aquaporin-4 isoform X1 n=1 Tax=Agrilus planipennis TaxID=224129 RepID=A0A7F5QXI2_AGRPL|nr:aquaporin-4 isoform X1 [Agrilus planipennis]